MRGRSPKTNAQVQTSKAVKLAPRTKRIFSRHTGYFAKRWNQPLNQESVRNSSLRGANYI
jgi:hypothetical protein